MTVERQSGLVQLFEHRWSTIDWAIARLTVSIENIAARNALLVQSWDEDGLGPTTGCAGRLPSGVAIQLLERAHLVSHFGARGPDLYADATDAQRVGIENLIAEALSALGLAPSDVEWRNQAPTVDEVMSLQRSVDETRRHAATRASNS
ncbi:hypothetical protein [uncultured Bradyrhizobium sp.]|uniref:hypothetical protein n=1 Tax=Bradyrhizobium sp. TaxID=376 RepID=UPI0026098D67|nr:hypothetical protein [uncultured Bradyrhizobium sp.]